MTPADLNRRAFELAGWQPPAGVHCIWKHPDHRALKLVPDFHSSLDAIRQWLWPVIEAKGLQREYMLAFHGPDSWDWAIVTAPPSLHLSAFLAVMEASHVKAE